MVFYFFSLYFDILVINYLTPVHFMFGSLIYLFLNELTQLIISLIKKNTEEKYQYNINILNLSSFICSFIGFVIYLEIIELNFCNLNYNLRKKIKERSIIDTYEDDMSESIISDENSERSKSIKIKIEFPINEQ